MKYSVKQMIKEISIIVFFGFMFIAPLTALYLKALNSEKKIDEINKKYDQKLSEIRECKTIECVNKVMGATHE